MTRGLYRGAGLVSMDTLWAKRHPDPGTIVSPDPIGDLALSVERGTLAAITYEGGRVRLSSLFARPPLSLRRYSH